MRTTITTLALALIAALPAAAQTPAAPPAPRPLTLTSTAFADGTVIPNRYTQAGVQVSPALA